MPKKNLPQNCGRFLPASVMVSCLKFKHCYSVRRQRICKGILLPVAFLLDCFVHQRPFPSCSSVPFVVAVQDQLILLAPGYADPVVLPLHRSEVAYKQEVSLPVLGISHEAENASENVVLIDPFKAFFIRIHLVKRLVLPVQMQKLLHPVRSEERRVGKECL